jgi:hypothetical protein
MSLKLEKIQEKIDQAKKAEALAQKDLGPKAQARQQAEEALRRAEAEESEKTRLRQEAHRAFLAAHEAEGQARAALGARTAERQKWEKAIDAALEE